LNASAEGARWDTLGKPSRRAPPVAEEAKVNERANRSIAPDRAQGDYICEVRCREANRERREYLSAMLALISAKQKPQFQRKGCAFCFFLV
jgi:hypothetical protein